MPLSLEALPATLAAAGIEPNVVVVGVHPGQYRSAGGATKGVGEVGSGEGHALLAEQVLRLGHVLEVVVAHVVGDYEYEVGLRARLGTDGRAAAIGSPQKHKSQNHRG